MKRAILTLAIGLLSTQAHAHHGHHARSWPHGRAAVQRHNHAAAHFSTARPRDCYGIPWCGCFMRHLMGETNHALNLARAWATWGHRSDGPGRNVVVVWRHHVGLIVARGRNGLWIVLSGNDGHAVRERPRSLAGAIAFRSP